MNEKKHPSAIKIETNLSSSRSKECKSLEELGVGIELLSGVNGEFAQPENSRKQVAIVRIDGHKSQLELLHIRSASQSILDSLTNLLTQNKFNVQRRIVLSNVLQELYREQGDDDTIQERSEYENDFNTLLLEAVDSGASDIHIENRPESTTVKFRINGILRKHKKWNRPYASNMCSVIYNVISLEQDNNYSPKLAQDAVIDTQINDLNVRLRLQTAPCFPGHPFQSSDMILRVLVSGKKEKYTPLNILGYTDKQTKDIHKAISEPQGILILSGTTGSGKSTTLKNLLDYLGLKYKYRIRIQTVEDPVEYQIEHASQTSVNRSKDIKKTIGEDQFSEYIRVAMRMDPDILMVGEIRDATSASTASKATLTGHQVLTTIHAGSPFETVSRLIDLGVSTAIIRNSSFISGLVNQKLVPVLCGNCCIDLNTFKSISKQNAIDQAFLNRLEIAAGSPGNNLLKHVKFRNDKGCPKCNSKTPGIIGRTVIAEVVLPDEELYKMFAEQKLNEARTYWLSKLDGLTLQQHAFQKMIAGKVDPRDVEEKTGWLGTNLGKEFIERYRKAREKKDPGKNERNVVKIPNYNADAEMP